MKKRTLYIGATIIGMIFGYMYYHFYGCTNGCMITGNPWRSTLYFGFLFFLGSTLLIDIKQKNHE